VVLQNIEDAVAIGIYLDDVLLSAHEAA
jgi:hypothetical protein